MSATNGIVASVARASAIAEGLRHFKERWRRCPRVTRKMRTVTIRSMYVKAELQLQRVADPLCSCYCSCSPNSKPLPRSLISLDRNDFIISKRFRVDAPERAPCRTNRSSSSTTKPLLRFKYVLRHASEAGRITHCTAVYRPPATSSSV